MAAVYMAYDSHIKRRVAIKVLPAQFMQIPLFQQRFHQEAELVARFHHPSIVGIYDFGEHDGQPFIVMQYLPKGTLANRLQYGSLSLQKVSPIIERVAAALDEAHGQGVIHHDVKPANIIFNGNDQALLSDFGIAVLAEALATLSHNTHIGYTPKYVSPERVRAFQQQDFSVVDWRSDIYSLGVIVFEALAGQPPFHGATATAMALAHVHEPIPRISAINPALPEAYQEIIDRALAKRPADRYQSAGELAQDVKEMSSSRWFLRKLLD
jgi:serine/threonine protein kinase